jgi:hypothetical protein
MVPPLVALWMVVGAVIGIVLWQRQASQLATLGDAVADA